MSREELLNAAAVHRARALEFAPGGKDESYFAQNTPGNVAKLRFALVAQLEALRLTILAGPEPQPLRVPERAEVEPGWYFVELMGHRRRHGRVDVVTLAGRQFVEIHTPEQVPTYNTAGEQTGVELQWLVERYSPAAIFSLRESTSEQAHDAADRGLADVDDDEIPF